MVAVAVVVVAAASAGRIGLAWHGAAGVVGKLSAASPAAVAGRGRDGFGWAGVVAVAGLSVAGCFGQRGEAD
jgi:hypothetical protein